MLRYLEEGRYTCTCDVCGKHHHFKTISKVDAKHITSMLGYRIFMLNGIDYCVCNKCMKKNKELFEDMRTSDKEALKRFVEEYY